MPLDAVRMADTRGWLAKAANDLRGAEIDLAAKPPLVEDALFHCQQASEKAFKAFLTFHNVPFRKTHNLEELGEACLKIDATPKAVVDEAVPLTEFAWAFRYPGDPPTPSMEETQAALAAARKVFETVMFRIPSEAHS